MTVTKVHTNLITMKPKSLILCVITALGIFVSQNTHAAAYIKFDGVDGESQNQDHKGWSDALSFQFGASRATDAAGGSRARPTDVRLSKELDKSTPRLIQMVVEGEVVPVLIIEFTKRGPQGEVPYLRYELKNVLVSSYSVSGSSEGSAQLGDIPGTPTAADTVPIENMILNFEEIKVTYREIDMATWETVGRVEYEWRVEEGTAAH